MELLLSDRSGETEVMLVNGEGFRAARRLN